MRSPPPLCDLLSASAPLQELKAPYKPRRPSTQPKLNRKKLWNTLPAPDPEDHKYQLKAGVILERMPRLFRDKEPWELTMEQMQAQRAKNPKRQGDYRGLPEYLRDDEAAKAWLEERKAKAKLDGESQEDYARRFGEWQAKVAAEAEEKKNMPRLKTTEDDRNNNRHSLNRKLQSSLFLLVKKDRQEHAWQFPQGGWEDGETIRKVRRCCNRAC